MNAALAFRRVALTLVLLSVAAYAASERSVWVLVIGGVAAVAAATITEGPRGRALPAWAVRLFVLAAMVWGTVDFFSRAAPNPADAPRVVGEVVLAVLLLKLFERKRASEWRQALALSVVLVVAGALASSEFLVGMLVMAYAACSIAAVMLYQLYAGEERATQQRRAAAPTPAALPPIEIPGGASPARQLRRVIVASTLLGLVLSVSVFVLFPREAVYGMVSPGGRQSGFKPDLALWSGERISLSSRVAMTVQLLDPRGVPGDLATPLRLRGAVLERYNQRESLWTARRPENAKDHLFETIGPDTYEWFIPQETVGRSNLWTEVVEMRSLASDYVFTAWLPLAIQCDEPRLFSVNPATSVITGRSGGMAGRPARYKLQMQAFPVPALVQAATPAGVPATEVSFPVPEIREEAERILASAQIEGLPTEEQIAADPALRWERNRRIARIFETYLSSSSFRYTTDLSGFRRGRGRDPIVLFLKQYRYGHCEYFASAMAALCQSVGIEARVVTGFMSTEYDGSAERYIVRESSAHAWVEVRTGDWQWSTFDASPMAELLAIQQANRTWLDRFRWLLDPVEFAWNSRVATFDSGAQAELAERFGTRVGRMVDAAREWASNLVARVNDWFLLGQAGALWLGLLGVLGAIAVIALFSVLRRLARVREELGGGRAGRMEQAMLGRDAGFYLDALDLLAKAGLEKPRSRTPRLHAERIGERAPAAGEAFAAVVDRFYEVRYQGRRLSRQERVQAQELVRRLGLALSQTEIRRSKTAH